MKIKTSIHAGTNKIKSSTTTMFPDGSSETVIVYTDGTIVYLGA